jgi:23S rRNA (uracil1939-C5)-methyltransferase
MSANKRLQVGRQKYGGLAKTSDPDVRLPFVMRNEVVEVSADGRLIRIVEQTAERVPPLCPHFTVCGGCQYQMIATEPQGDVKRAILQDILETAGLQFPVEIPAHTGPGYEYRNRIRLRVQRVDGALRLGYNQRATTEFLPILTCPIAAPVLWRCAEALLATASDKDVAFWLDAASEVELFTDDRQAKVQVTLRCAPRTKVQQGSLDRFLAAVRGAVPEVVGIGAIASDPRTGPTGRTFAEVGAAGLNYRVLDETYWVPRGGFFQVNRFLLGELVKLVCEVDGVARHGAVAWDLYAGVGLFSRVLARGFARVVAAEANAVATSNNQVALRKIGATHEAVCVSILEFVERATMQRERPELIVLDPPRAGAGVDVCELLLRIAAPQMVYVSCDPTTLARDLQVLTRGYVIRAMHVVDLFPQTFHLETVVVLECRK